MRCLPDNPPRAWTLPHLTKAMHTPKLLVLLYEVNAMYRQIFIDGRPLPDDPTPGWNGYSTARWEGDTLVVQTAGFRDDLWIDTGGSPMSDAAKMTERIRRPNYGTLEIELTIDDPKVYTRPFTVKLTQNIELDTELIDEFCLENEKSYRADAAIPRQVARSSGPARVNWRVAVSAHLHQPRAPPWISCGAHGWSSVRTLPAEFRADSSQPSRQIEFACSHGPAGREAVVVGQHRARVQRVVQVERDHRRACRRT